MKTNKLLRFALCITMALLLCTGIVGCSRPEEQSDPPENKSYTTNVRSTELAAHGDYVIAEWGKLYIFERSTETFRMACNNPECDGNRCPLECVINYFAGTSNGKVYFSGVQQFTHNTLLSYLDLETGESGTLKTISEAEDSGNPPKSFVEDGWWYYQRKILKEGGDAENPIHYDLWLYKLALDGQQDQPIRMLKDTEVLLMAGAGQVITEYGNKLYTTNTQSGDVYELYDLGANGFSNLYTDPYYLDGKIYFLAASYTTVHSEYTKQDYPLPFLICIDLETKEARQLLEQPLMALCVTDDAIYYSLFELKHLYIPDDYEKKPNSVMVYLLGDALYKCDLNGENSEEVYATDQIHYAHIFTVIDDVLYGWLFDYNDETHTYDKTFFGAIELKTGRVIRTEKPQRPQPTQTEN